MIPAASSKPALRIRRQTSRAKLPLSAFIICLNEEPYLANCIESLQQCTEIIIVDSGSTDGTKNLVQHYIDQGWPIRFMYEKWRGYAGQKQFAFEQCTQPWCLSIDADERLDESLQCAFPELLQVSQDTQGYRIPRRPYLIGSGAITDDPQIATFTHTSRRVAVADQVGSAWDAVTLCVLRDL
jgi:hypothetical protein